MNVSQNILPYFLSYVSNNVAETPTHMPSGAYE